MYRDLTKRILALALSVCMIAGMVDLSGLTVHAADADNLISGGSAKRNSCRFRERSYVDTGHGLSSGVR